MAHIAKYKARSTTRDALDAVPDGTYDPLPTVADGIRGAVGRLEVAIADLARKLAPRSARMTTRALKRDLAALEKDMSPVTLASEARDALDAVPDGTYDPLPTVADGIRGAVGRLEVAIADLARKLAPRSARMTTRALKRDLAALEKDMSPVTLASEARDALDAVPDGTYDPLPTVADGIRGAVGRLEVAIADLARKLAPRSARMTTRALKRDLAALEKDMSPVTLASEAREAARASNARRGNVPQRDRGQSR